MILPRQLYRTASGEFCEADDPAQAWVYYPKGTMVSDAEAERIGLTAYLEAYDKAHPAPASPEDAPAVEAKAVDQAETEDKAVELESTEVQAEPGPGLHVDRTSGRGRRGT